MWLQSKGLSTQKQIPKFFKLTFASFNHIMCWYSDKIIFLGTHKTLFPNWCIILIILKKQSYRFIKISNRILLIHKGIIFYVYRTVHHCDNWRIKTQLDATCYFIVRLIGSTCFEHYYAHHQELATMCLSLQPGHYSSLTAPHLQHTANQEWHNQCGKQHHSCELLMMGIVMLETCWA